MKKGVYSMYRINSGRKTGIYIASSKKTKLYQEIEVRKTISISVSNDIYNQMLKCVKGMSHSIAEGLGMRG